MGTQIQTQKLQEIQTDTEQIQYFKITFHPFFLTIEINKITEILFEFFLNLRERRRVHEKTAKEKM